MPVTYSYDRRHSSYSQRERNGFSSRAHSMIRGGTRLTFPFWQSTHCFVALFSSVFDLRVPFKSENNIGLRAATGAENTVTKQWVDCQKGNVIRVPPRIIECAREENPFRSL